MASQPSTSGLAHDLACKVQELERELTEARQQHAATGEILRVISATQTDVQQVFDTIIANAVKLCSAHQGAVYLYDGELVHLGAHRNYAPEIIEILRRMYPRRPQQDQVSGRAILNRAIAQIEDMRADPLYSPELTLAGAWRSQLAVPMVREGRPIGAIVIARPEAGSFSASHIELLKTFANQAVIAIENTRLFEEVQARTGQLTEALEFQTATSGILRIISSVPTEIQPVFDAIAASAAKLCGALLTGVYRFDGKLIHFVAHNNWTEEGLHTVRTAYPRPPSRDTQIAKAILERTVVEVRDFENDLEVPSQSLPLARALGYRSLLAVPMLHEGNPIGAIAVARSEAGPFSIEHVELVKTFADQAVIAIENARLFEAEQASKRELQESLEFQTASSEVLNVISRSPAQLQPVLNTIVETASRLCKADHAHVFRLQDGKYHLVAHNQTQHHIIEYLSKNPIDLDQLGSVTARAARACKTVHVPDAMQDPEYGHGPLTFSNDRTVLSVPLLREGSALGIVTVGRQTLRPFTGKEIELVESFADQAVIAIENARLFEAEQASKRELARSVEELESLGKVSQAVNSSLELDKVLPTILEHACAMSYAGGGTVYVFDKTTSEFRLAAAHNMSDDHIAMVRAQPMRLNSVVVGECATRREVVQVADLSSAAPSPLLDILLRTGVRAVLAVPLLHQAEVVGVLVVRRNQPGTFSPEVIRLVEAFAAQSAIAVENARLFGEIAQKSRELEIASQHKSQFVANMSHELRTPLAAILGYAELIQEGFYGALPEKSMDALTRIRSNGKHLLGLINTVLDIAKIESGQFALNMTEYAIESVVETVRSATESLAQNKKLALKTRVAKPLPIGLGDEQRLTQVLLNLVGNAIKFTDAGEVRVTAKSVNDHFTVSVTDTGPGIPEEHQVRIFDQFHQVDSSNTKAKGGTGLGLAIARQIVEMHGGRIWVDSTLGKGSTFQMELPVRAAAPGVGQ